ncbi:MAG: STAS domain-containing protein [Betaproteobacteria bacterium]|nr:STAS domain-containing protein [Betaproteobacteria bacterium]
MTRDTNKDAARIALEQDLTIYNAGAVKKLLLDALAANHMLEIDLSRVAEIDTAGIQLLILAKRESLRQKRSLRIVAHSPAVHDAIDFFDLASYFGDPLLIPAQEAA